MKHVIIGTGPAGVIAAETLRKRDPNADITLIGEEPEQPYSRMAIPYHLIGDIEEEGTHLRKTADHFASKNITLLQQRVTELSADNKQVTLDNGDKLDFDKLLLATGSRAMKPPIPGMDLPNVVNCWTLADARKIIAGCQKGDDVVLMGAGFIGCIILEALAKRGVNLTVVEMENRMVPRMMDEKSGTLLKTWCENQGVRVLTSTRVNAVREDKPEASTEASTVNAASSTPAESSAATSTPAPAVTSTPAASTPVEKTGFFASLLGFFGKKPTPVPTPVAKPEPVAEAVASVSAVESVAASVAQTAPISDKLIIEMEGQEDQKIDLLICATGVKSNLELAEGLDTNHGILVNDKLQTSHPDIYAAGDVAEGKDFSTGGFSVQAIQPTAVEHGYIAAMNMTDGHESLHRGSINMNILDTMGLISTSFGAWEGVEGGEESTLYDPERFRYINLQFDGDKLVGANTLGMTQHVGVMRGLIQNQTSLGKWKDKLMENPTLVMDAYLAHHVP